MSEIINLPEGAKDFKVPTPESRIPAGRVRLITDDLRSPEELLNGIRRNRLEQIKCGIDVQSPKQHNYSTDETMSSF